MSKGSSRRPGDQDAFSKNFDAIFGTKQPELNASENSDSKKSESHIKKVSSLLNKVKDNSQVTV